MEMMPYQPVLAKVLAKVHTLLYLYLKAMRSPHNHTLTFGVTRTL